MQLLATWLVAFQAIRLDGGRYFKGVHLSQVHQPNKRALNIAQLVQFCLDGALLALASGKAERRQLHPLKKALRNRNKKPPDMRLCPAAYTLLYKVLKGGGALVSSAPTKLSSAPTKQELLQYCSVGALETSAPPESTP